MLKVSLGYRDGFIGEGQISCAGAGAVARGRLASAIVADRLKRAGIGTEEIRYDLVGVDALHGVRPEAGGRDPYEVRVRVAGRTVTAADAERIANEVEALYANGPAGGGGATRSVREVVAGASIGQHRRGRAASGLGSCIWSWDTGGERRVTRPWNRRGVRTRSTWALIARAQLMAASTILRASFAPASGALPTFVVHSRGRTGSTLLVDLLRCHPAIHCDAEILSHRLWVTSPWALVRGRARLFARQAYGFKLRPPHYATQRIHDPVAFLGGLHAAGWRFVRLTRQNALRTAISGSLIAHTGVLHRRVGDEPTARAAVRIRPDDLLARLERQEREMRLEADTLASFPCLGLTYEDDLLREADRQPALDRVFAYLGLPSAQVSTRYVRLTTDRLTDVVANYDEIASALRDTPYARFLDEE
jgi:hypothetical protein